MAKVEIGIIGAMAPEVEELVASLKSKKEEKAGGVTFYRGKLGKRKVVIAKCGVGKVFAALTAEAMIMKYAPKLIINTGVGGALRSGISVGDVLFADKLVQHDMDTSPLGDPKGLISGINKVYFEADVRAKMLVLPIAKELGAKCHVGTVASGDVFVSTSELKAKIKEDFDASVCEMEGAAIAHVAYAKLSAAITNELCKRY